MSPLHVAAAQGSLTTLDPYKSSSIHFDVDEIDRRGRTALIYAALKGHIDVVKLLLSENANVNHTDEKNRTPLWFASFSHSSVPQQRRREVIEYLLLKGADPDVQAKDGSTALMKLIENRDSGAIRLLIQKGASTTIVVEKREMSVYEILTGVRRMSKRIAALRSPEGIVSRDEERFFFEEMEEIKPQLKNYGRIVRVWPPGDTTNTVLFELGDTCIAAGLIDEAIETLELLIFLLVNVFECDDQGLRPTEKRLARAYKVKQALQEVDEQLGHDADLNIEPNKSKALDIFVRTEAGMKHAQTIWGPNIWNIQQIPQDTVDNTQQESYAQAQQFPMDLVQEDPEPSEESGVQEGIDLAGHNRQDSSRADDDRRVPMDPPGITEFASERYFEKLRQLQTDHQQTNDDGSNATTTATAPEFILPLRDSSSPTDEKPQPSARGKKRFLSLRQKAAAHATHRLSSVDIIAEQEAAGSPYLFRKEDNEMRGEGFDNEGEIGVLREMFRVLVEESQAEFEQAPEGTELKLEAQTLARTLAQQTTLYMLDVEELKIQHFEATNILERNEKGRAWINKIRSYDFGGMRDMIKEIQKKREAEEARRAEAARERNEKQAQSEKRLLLKIEEANKELLEHEERKERHKQALEAIYAKRGLEDSSAAPPELGARDASTEVPTRTEMSKSELNTHEEEIAAEDEKIRDAINALKQELRRIQAEKEVQVPSGSESQKAQSRGSKTTWQCCQCGTRDLEFHVDYYCTERDCRHPFCHNCLINFDYVGSA
ncbi:hypothetical protein HDV62DRAFT_215847 [Trichoderma sp. SZMC 28011]